MKKRILVPVLLALSATLGGCLGGGGDGTYSVQNAKDGAAFRLEAREVIGKLNPVCPYTAKPDLLARYDEPRARYAKLKKWVSDTPFIVDLAVIEADYDQYWTANSAECGPVDSKDGLATMTAEMDALSARLANLEKLAGMI